MVEVTNSPLVVGVRFSKVGKVYHFESNGLTDIKVGDMVVVETSRGWQLGQVAQIIENAEKPPEGWKPIDRLATPRDLLLRQMWQQKEAEVVAKCRSKAEDLRLSGIKIIMAEYSFDGSRLTILFSSETEEKFDLKSLRGDLQKMFAPSQVDLRQIGPRDVAKVMCGMGACGLETRCCCAFLTEFSSISIRMAKEQNISLTPSEITGMCGRLRCCLIYEYDQYVDARKALPRRNKRVRTPLGEGKVVDIIPMRDMVVVDLPGEGRREFLGSEVTLVDGEPGSAPAAGAEPPTPQVVSEPSEIDQALTGNEISPDPVAGVGDFGTQKPETRPSREGRRRSGKGRRGGGGGERKAGTPGPQEPKGPQESKGRSGWSEGQAQKPSQESSQPDAKEQNKPGSPEQNRSGKEYRNKRKGRRHGGDDRENRT